MKKNFPKVSYLILISIFTISFLTTVVGQYFIRILNLSYALSIFFIFLSSLFATIIIAIGLSAFIPSLNDAITTLRRLLRFESFSNPLLMRLSYEAPGTFHHVINVSILAQKAAKTIGADALLVRIGAYYHDLGKLNDPAIYIENQSGSEIPNAIDAELIRKSAARIISHVRKGVELARQNHLPDEIINIIAEHHGTTRALYFYEEAKRQGLKIKKTDFKYDGPTPQSRESAIIMIADSVEAATRAIPNLTKSEISSIVENTLMEKIGESQFKNSGLKDNDLVMIKESMAETLSSIYHQRIVINQQNA